MHKNHTYAFVLLFSHNKQECNLENFRGGAALSQSVEELFLGPEFAVLFDDGVL